MAVELHRLIEKVAHMDITLLAGEGGVHNLVSWIHMIETMEASEFLDGGEIAFTTGLGLSHNTSLLDLVTSIFNRNAAGIIVNTGPFLEEVPQEVLSFCNQHNFPIYRIPWKIHLAEIMRIFCFTISKDEQRNLETSAAFKNAIFFPKQEELYVVPLSQQGFHVNGKYSVCVLRIKQPKSAKAPRSERLENLTMSLENYLYHCYQNFAIFTHGKEILAVVANYKELQLQQFVRDLQEKTRLFLLPEEECTFGVGKLTKSIRCLYKSYHQAISIQKLQAKHKIDKSLLFYSDMGIYKLLMGIEDLEIIQEYYDHTVAPLQHYDRENDADLTKILRSYLNHNGSVKETADELFVHRNTINYKLKKIEELLNMDLSELDSRLQMNIGFMLQDML